MLKNKNISKNIRFAQNNFMKSVNDVPNGNKKQVFLLVFTGVLSGLVNGLFGGGGGMIVVPMLTKLLKYKTKNAHATAIMIILPLSLLSGLFYVAFGNLNLKVAIPVTIGVVGGGVLGACLLSKLSSKWLVIVFSFVMAFAGAKMLLF